MQKCEEDEKVKIQGSTVGIYVTLLHAGQVPTYVGKYITND